MQDVQLNKLFDFITILPMERTFFTGTHGCGGSGNRRKKLLFGIYNEIIRADSGVVFETLPERLYQMYGLKTTNLLL